MHSIWTKGVKPADKAQRRKEVLAYKNSFDALIEVLDKNIKKKEAVRDYSNPNWLAEQIAVNEYNAAVDEIKKLITFK